MSIIKLSYSYHYIKSFVVLELVCFAHVHSRTYLQFILQTLPFLITHVLLYIDTSLIPKTFKTLRKIVLKCCKSCTMDAAILEAAR